MKTITKFRTDDGYEFDSEQKAAEHEQLVERCKQAVAVLPSRRKIDHGKYVQHDREACLQAKRNMLALVRWEYDQREWKVLQNADDDIHPMSMVGRILSDAGGPLNDYWNRFCCIDFATGREYDQPYFALNPMESEGEME